MQEARLTPRVAIAASWLPGAFHGDPGDRLIVATAREIGLPVVTRERAVVGSGRVVGVGCKEGGVWDDQKMIWPFQATIVYRSPLIQRNESALLKVESDLFPVDFIRVAIPIVRFLVAILQYMR